MHSVEQDNKLSRPSPTLSYEDIPPNDRLPREILPSFQFRELLIMVTGMITVVLCVNMLIIFFLGNYTTNFGYYIEYQKWQLLKRLDEPVDWLILGDSSVNQGVIPSIFETKLHERAINLGTNGNMILLDDLWMLEYYIQKFGPPENIVIVHVYDVWQRDFNPVLLGQIPLTWGFWKRFSATETLVWNRNIQRDIFLEHYAPIYSQNKTLGQIFQETFIDFRNPFQSRWRIDGDGYTLAYVPMPDIVVADAKDHIKFASENKFHLADLNQRVMDQIKMLANEYGINVYILMGPQYKGLNADPNFQRYLKSVMDELSRYSLSSDRIQFISDIKTFSADQMQNTDHLIDSSAREYTNWLISQIQKYR